MSARQAIAEATTLADLVNVTPFYRQSLRPGDGFVRLAGRERDDSGFGWIDRWEVWVAIPEDITVAEQWLEEHLSELIEAAEVALYVTSATPAELILGDSVCNGVIIAGSIPA